MAKLENGRNERLDLALPDRIVRAFSLKTMQIP